MAHTALSQRLIHSQERQEEERKEKERKEGRTEEENQSKNQKRVTEGYLETERIFFTLWEEALGVIWSEVGGGGGVNGVVVSCWDINENEPKVSASTRKETNAQNDFEKGFEVDIFIGLHNSENQMFEGSVKIY